MLNESMDLRRHIKMEAPMILTKTPELGRVKNKNSFYVNKQPCFRTHN